MENQYICNNSELNKFKSSNDNLISTLNRKNLNSLNVRFSNIDSNDLLTCKTGDTMYKTTNRQTGGNTELILHTQHQSQKPSNKSNLTSNQQSNKHTTLPKSSQLNQLNQLNTPLIDENIKCSLLVKWLCSPPLLCVLLLGYACFGALLFSHLESGAEMLSVANVATLRNNTLQRLWNITFTFNLLYPKNWTTNAAIELQQFERAVIYMVKQHGYNGFTNLNQPNALALHESAHDRVEQWTISGALLYSLTIISTIGSGNLSPRTSSGKIATIIYALFGIPLMLLFLTSIGNILAEQFRRFYRSCCYCSRKQQALAKQEAKQRQIDLQQLYRLQYLQQQRLKNRIKRKQKRKQNQTQIRNTNNSQLHDHFHVHLLNSAQQTNETSNNLFSATLLPDGQQLLTENSHQTNANAGQHNTVTFLEPDPMNKLASISSTCTDANCGLLLDHSTNVHSHTSHLVPTSSSQNSTGIHYCTISNRQQLNNPNIPAYCNSAHHQLIASNQIDPTLNYGTSFKYGTLPNTVIINQAGLDGKSALNPANCCTVADQTTAALLYNQNMSNTDHYHLDNYGNLLNLTETGQQTLTDNQMSTYLQTTGQQTGLSNDLDEQTAKLTNELNYLNTGTNHLIETNDQKDSKNLLKKLNNLNNIKEDSDDEFEDLDDKLMNELDILDDPLLYSLAIELSKDSAAVQSSSANKVQVPVSLCVILILIYVVFGAILLHIWERRNLLDAIYYCFLTLMTIGYNSAASSATSTTAQTPFGSGWLLDFVDSPKLKKTTNLINNNWSADNQHSVSNYSINGKPQPYGHTSSVVLPSYSLNSQLNSHNNLKTSLLGSLNIAEPNNQLLVLFAIYLVCGMLLIAMCFNLVQDHLVLRVLNRYDLVNKRNLARTAQEMTNLSADQPKMKNEMQSNLNLDTDDDFDV